MKSKAKYKRDKHDFDKNVFNWLKRYVLKNTCRNWKRNKLKYNE